MITPSATAPRKNTIQAQRFFDLCGGHKRRSTTSGFPTRTEDKVLEPTDAEKRSHHRYPPYRQRRNLTTKPHTELGTTALVLVHTETTLEGLQLTARCHGRHPGPGAGPRFGNPTSELRGTTIRHLREHLVFTTASTHPRSTTSALPVETTSPNGSSPILLPPHNGDQVATPRLSS